MEFTPEELAVATVLLRDPPPRLPGKKLVEKVAAETGMDLPDVWFGLMELKRKQIVGYRSFPSIYKWRRYLFGK